MNPENKEPMPDFYEEEKAAEQESIIRELLDKHPELKKKRAKKEKGETKE